MPIRIVPDVEKRKAKRGVTPGRSKTHWPKRPYKDYTKIKHTNLIQTLDGRKKGQIQESGPPGTEKKLHDKSMKRLNELQKLKSREGTRMTSGAQRKRKEHLQKGGYKAGGRANFRGGGRTNLLEELGRVEAEPSNRNRRAEISRVHGELNRGYKDGKRVGLKHGTRGPHGFGPKPFLNKPGQAQGTHGGKIVKASDKAIKGNKLTKKA